MGVSADRKVYGFSVSKIITEATPNFFAGEEIWLVNYLLLLNWRVIYVELGFSVNLLEKIRQDNQYPHFNFYHE